MDKKFGRFNISTSGRIAVLLDTSDSADNYWGKIVEISQSISSRLSAKIEKRFFALGNPVSFPESLLNSPALIKGDNKNRGSFISPIMENLEGHFDKIVVIGSGLIFDIDDWVSEENYSRFIFINVAGKALCPFDMGIKTNGERFVSHIDDIKQSIDKVSITSKNFMPFYWDNEAYQLVFIDGKAVLEAENSCSYNLNIGYYGEQADAFVTTGKGVERRFQLSPAEEPPEVNWEEMSPGEKEIFIKASLGEEYLCPYCGEMHDTDEIRCENVSGLWGRLIYESLEGKSGMIEFWESGKRVLFRCHRGGACPAGENLVAAGSGGVSRLYRFDGERRKWREIGLMDKYFSIAPNRRLLWL